MRVVVVGLLAASILAGCGPAKPSSDPGAFALSLTSRILANRYADAWNDLNPADQKVAPLAEYVDCESRSPIVIKPLSLKVMSVTSESVGLGNKRFVASRAVHVRIGFAGGFSLVHTVHVVASGSRWTWILPAWRYRDYLAGRCPTAQTGEPSA